MQKKCKGHTKKHVTYTRIKHESRSTTKEKRQCALAAHKKEKTMYCLPL